MASKFSFAYVKKNPVMFGAIFIVFGLLFWLLISRGGGGSSSGTTFVNAGPSEQLQAAQMQTGAALQAKQIDAAIASQRGALELEALTRQIEGQENLAVMQQAYMLAELQANSQLSQQQTAASLAALQSQFAFSLAQTESNNQATIDYARVAAESATTQLAIGAALQRDLSAQQLDAYKYGLDTSVKQTALSVIPTLKKKDRDSALISLSLGADSKSGRIVSSPYTSGFFNSAQIQPSSAGMIA